MTIDIFSATRFQYCRFMMCVGTCVSKGQASKSVFNTVSDDVPFAKPVLITGTDSIIRIFCILQ